MNRALTFAVPLALALAGVQENAVLEPLRIAICGGVGIQPGPLIKQTDDISHRRAGGRSSANLLCVPLRRRGRLRITPEAAATARRERRDKQRHADCQSDVVHRPHF